MALYSWFSRIDNKPSIKNTNINSNLLKTSETVKYIENYTMWPTAKIKPNVEIAIPSYANTSITQPTVILATGTNLMVIKS